MATAFPYIAGYFYDDVTRNGSIGAIGVACPLAASRLDKPLVSPDPQSSLRRGGNARLASNSQYALHKMASNSQYALPPQSSPQESAPMQLRHSKQSSKVPSPENFVTIGGCFERYTYCVMVLCWLKKKERRKKKKMNNSDLQQFQVFHFN